MRNDETGITLVHVAYHEKITPYVRMTQRSKYVNEAAQRYLASKDRLQLHFRQVLARRSSRVDDYVLPFPPQKNFGLELAYGCPRTFSFDLDNLVKAVLDAAQGVIYPDDRYCVEIRASKLKSEKFGADIIFYLEQPPPF